MVSTTHTLSFATTTKKGLSSNDTRGSVSWLDSEIRISRARKYSLLVGFSFAQFLDTLNVSALVTAIPAISLDLKMEPSETVWLLSAYQLTFAAFLLLSGRLADLFNAKYLFTGGFASLGIISIGAGFVDNKIGLLVLRAFTGITAAATIPSALHLIVHLFPNRSEQEMAISIFGGSAAIGNVMGIVIGALFEQFASWRWIFWFNGCVALPISAFCLFMIPDSVSDSDYKNGTNAGKMKRLDVFGVSVLTAGFLLFIFALTTAPADGWGTAKVLVPLIISIFMIAGFFYHESRVPEDKAALPPKIWFYPNFGALFGLALLPFFWFGSLFILFTPLWQTVYGWSPIIAAVRMLPLGLVAFPTVLICAILQNKVRLKTLLVIGSFLLIPSTLLLPFGDRPDRFWPIIFPALFIGSAGATMIFANANLGMFKFTPPSMAGTVAAVFNSALQLGAAVGLAIVTSIETNVERHQGGFASYKGRAAAFYFLFAIVVLAFLSTLIFIREEKDTPHRPSAAALRAATTKSKSDLQSRSEDSFVLDIKPRTFI